MYFDPGVGSLLIQAVVASIAVIGGYFAIAKTKLKDLFSKKGTDAEKQGEKDDDDTL